MVLDMSRAKQPYKFKVVEVFGPTIQGEGALCGVPTHFIRFGGCGYRCNWCDTMYAVEPAEVKANSTLYTAQELTEKVKALGNIGVVTLSGGDPCLIGDPMSDLIQKLHTEFLSLQIAVETQGEFYQDWLGIVDVITLSPKPPSSGMKPDFAVLERIVKNFWRRIVLKIVISDEDDFQWMLEMFVKNPEFNSCPLYLQSCTPQDSPMPISDICTNLNWLAERVVKESALIGRRWGVHVLPQMHRLMYPNQTRGV